jgi:hypothetical protein
VRLASSSGPALRGKRSSGRRVRPRAGPDARLVHLRRTRGFTPSPPEVREDAKPGAGLRLAVVAKPAAMT